MKCGTTIGEREQPGRAGASGVDKSAGADRYTEVGAPEYRINQPFKGYVLTPQAFSTSNLALGPVLYCSGNGSLPPLPCTCKIKIVKEPAHGTGRRFTVNVARSPVRIVKGSLKRMSPKSRRAKLDKVRFPCPTASFTFILRPERWIEQVPQA